MYGGMQQGDEPPVSTRGTGSLLVDDSKREGEAVEAAAPAEDQPPASTSSVAVAEDQPPASKRALHARGFLGELEDDAIEFVKNKVELKGYGVLGAGVKDGKIQQIGETPGEDEVFVDPAGLHRIHDFHNVGRVRAGGAAAAIYKYIGLWNQPSFPSAVKDALYVGCPIGSTKLQTYDTPTDGKRSVIHVIGPDFRPIRHEAVRPGSCSQEKAEEYLATTYRNVLVEFVDSGRAALRLLPISSSIFGGNFVPQGKMPEITIKSLAAAYQMLNAGFKESLATKKVEMCIFEVEDMAVYQAQIDKL